MKIMAINKTARPTYKPLPYYLLAFLNRLCDNPDGNSPNVSNFM
jgi:hypothetical protein